MPYTSRDEITTAVEACVRDFIANGCNERCAFILVSLVSRNSYFILMVRPITERDINDHLMTSLGESPPLDILIRTSGVNRLSDFLLWQVRSIKKKCYSFSTSNSIDFLAIASAANRHNCSSHPPSGRNLDSLTSSLSSWTISEKYGTVA